MSNICDVYTVQFYKNSNFIGISHIFILYKTHMELYYIVYFLYFISFVQQIKNKHWQTTHIINQNLLHNAYFFTITQIEKSINFEFLFIPIICDIFYTLRNVVIHIIYNFLLILTNWLRLHNIVRHPVWSHITDRLWSWYEWLHIYNVIILAY